MKKLINFSKYSGAGNDFIIIENFRNALTPSQKQTLVVQVCDRHFGVGSDGAIFLEKSKEKDNLKWDFFNNDGSKAEMCLNASRCVALYAFHKLGKKTLNLETQIGTVVGRVQGSNVKVRIPAKISNAEKTTIQIGVKKLTGFYVNTGVPHFVLLESSVEESERATLNPQIRFHRDFGKAGANVTYMKNGRGKVFARTFERGVEDYTLACGTGAAAVAATQFKQKHKKETKVQMPGGLISVQIFFNYYEATGPAQNICDGVFLLRSKIRNK